MINIFKNKSKRMKKLREEYNVPARKWMRVEVTENKKGIIVGCTKDGTLLKVLVDGSKKPFKYHPLNEVKYDSFDEDPICWIQAPDWANWAVMDGLCRWYWCEFKPDLEDDEWIFNKGRVERFPSAPPESILHRPSVYTR